MGFFDKSDGGVLINPFLCAMAYATEGGLTSTIITHLF